MRQQHLKDAPRLGYSSRTLFIRNIFMQIQMYFGAQNSPLARWLPFSPQRWTWIGALAIPLWATWPALGLRSLEIPAFECQAIAFFCGWVVMMTRWCTVVAKLRQSVY